MCVEEYIEQRYTPKSRPAKKTIIRLIKQGDVPGKKIGKFYYVDVNAEACKTGNPLIDRVLGFEIC